MEDWHNYLLALRQDLLRSISRLESGAMKVFLNMVNDSERIAAEDRINVAEIEAMLTKAGVAF
jgi:hypothetical protein